MAGAAVPKTAVNKYCYFESWEYKVRLTNQGIITPPSGNALFFEK